MRRRISLAFLSLAALFLSAGLAGASPPGEKGTPPGLAKKGGAPPGQAKKAVLPPGLAKKYGPKRAGTVYVAFDRRHDDRAWFLVDGSWVLRSGFEADVRAEVKASLGLPPLPVPPPVPLPKVGVDLHVVLFG
jgi:hypothetical protein